MSRKKYEEYMDGTVFGDKKFLRSCFWRFWCLLMNKVVKQKQISSFFTALDHLNTLFAERSADVEILPPAAAKLNWKHFIELLPLKNDDARMYYA